jgi:hypothetical protein
MCAKSPAVYPNVYPLGTLAAMKDAGLRIRVQKELREQFVAACQAQDKPAAQVLREFMRQYVKKHGDSDSETREPKRGVK